MSKRAKNKKGSLHKGRTKYNRQWIREHAAHRGRLFPGEVDKLLGVKVQ